VARLIEAVNFETDEALLTGESLPVRKDVDVTFEDNTGPGDRLNVAYSSSTVTKGRATGIVFATANFTEIGAIATELRKKDSKVRPVKRKPDGSASPHRYLEAYTLTLGDAIGRFLGVNVGTPLQKKLSKLAILLFVIAIVCAIIVLGANRFESRQEVIIYAVATGLSMIPASLVVVLTITMAAGTKRMVRRNVIVRNLKSLEALGAVTDICSDKTGTLTQGKMVTRRAWVPAMGTYTVESTEPFDPTVGAMHFSTLQPSEIDLTVAESEKNDSAHIPQLLSDSKTALREYLQVAALANLATVTQNEDRWTARGDPTEIAIQVFASRFDLNRRRLTVGDKAEWTQLAELPFDSDVKRMSVIYEDGSTGEKWVYTKGAVERILDACSSYCPCDGEDSVEITEAFREDVIKNMDALSSTGLRVLALASKTFEGEIKKGEDVDRQSVETKLTFRGLIGLYDPPRVESAPAVRSCHEAGIQVHMLTGDHPGTARAIAIDVGILPKNMGRFRRDVADSMVMTATQFDSLTDDKIDALPVLPLVIARCSPSTKVRMIDALHRRKRFCAMVSAPWTTVRPLPTHHLSEHV
jgi:P-type Na+/K+ transporter